MPASTFMLFHGSATCAAVGEARGRAELGGDDVGHLRPSFAVDLRELPHDLDPLGGVEAGPRALVERRTSGGDRAVEILRASGGDAGDRLLGVG